MKFNLESFKNTPKKVLPFFAAATLLTPGCELDKNIKDLQDVTPDTANNIITNSVENTDAKLDTSTTFYYNGVEGLPAEVVNEMFEYPGEDISIEDSVNRPELTIEELDVIADTIKKGNTDVPEGVYNLSPEFSSPVLVDAANLSNLNNYLKNMQQELADDRKGFAMPGPGLFRMKNTQQPVTLNYTVPSINPSGILGDTDFNPTLTIIGTGVLAAGVEGALNDVLNLDDNNSPISIAVDGVDSYSGKPSVGAKFNFKLKNGGSLNFRVTTTGSTLFLGTKFVPERSGVEKPKDF